MKSFREWKEQYKDRAPTSWDEWLRKVYASLAAVEDSSGEEREKYEDRYLVLLRERAQLLETRAAQLGLHSASCATVDDILVLNQAIATYISLQKEWKVMEEMTSKLGIEFPPMREVQVSQLKGAQEFLQQTRLSIAHQQELEQSWLDLVERYTVLGEAVPFREKQLTREFVTQKHSAIEKKEKINFIFLTSVLLVNEAP